ncbi:OmpA family protein [Nocardiopsis composta]|uniref:Outer membrane protein OmpA-like peptidoglycan-associated protein n=1 Tax=Nocardiopsis composta TaxID=157465 RepID=A0A7W8QKN6_9ACTN|nr:OmpA family protein [Nocardiopsis composta]MBB5432217.1 outer membrane protein OmpA-like peptidoglycan-associated protein [Nocardiopsis composta]
MSRSADPRARLLALPAALLILGAPAAAQAEEDGPEEIVAESDAGPVAEAPVIDLNGNIVDLDTPVRDLVLSTSDEDGAVRDSVGGEERVVTLAADVLFEFDEAELTGDAQEALEEAAAVLREEAGGKTVRIDGYTDAKGDDAHNVPLSEARAEAVEKELTGLLDGVDVTFETAGHGSADPVAPNEVDGEDNPEGRAENRRVEIRFEP